MIRDQVLSALLDGPLPAQALVDAVDAPGVSASVVMETVDSMVASGSLVRLADARFARAGDVAWESLEEAERRVGLAQRNQRR